MMKNKTTPITITKASIDNEVKKLFELKLVIYNDDVNTFQHVIHCLLEYCKHSLEQAEQCANIIHSKGKYGVKNGSFKNLKPIANALLENYLSVKKE
jgi:ATP-dependent Clp protease adaptor protein ClpS